MILCKQIIKLNPSRIILLELSEIALYKIEKELKALINKAGLTLLDYFGKPLKVEYKDAHNTDPVTEVDRSVQDFLKKSIKV